MGLLSLFSFRKGKDAAPERARRARSADAGAAGARAGSRDMRRGGDRGGDDYADDMLDPEFPQKQRARRRLIGALVMTVAAVIVLPIVFETEPRPAADQIAVRLSGGQGEAQARPEPRKAAPLAPQQQSRLDAQALDAGEELVSAPAARAADKAPEKPAERTEAARQAEAKPDPKAESKAESKTDKAEAKSSGSGKYVILVGAFSTEDKARQWMSKLKANKVPAYIERKALADGERILLRAGPFSDRDAADAAEKRVRATGLTARVVEL
ncbi:SPOR domain-containing protein [Cupriavidus cauae]|uniref:Sporulation protein n=1 Tax=Cupriavidus cauae TaxID=2608999 RepID=A0A5M8AG10_9BURK|nr:MULTISPECIES: SPOR domain-containing protein [Cupriavidus]KAA0182450.1 sporulation protein [Cupriavidus gilardii]KAA6122777.1 sporulation protein [Cupriavidus cauae]MCA7084447.1 SPOR domain-containing protein [Cupriavidus sp. DB3]UZN48868.1 SPOR domain-containing protein [Cupriavidus cauae]